MFQLFFALGASWSTKFEFSNRLIFMSLEPFVWSNLPFGQLDDFGRTLLRMLIHLDFSRALLGSCFFRFGYI